MFVLGIPRSLQDLLSYKHHQYIGNIPLTSEIQFVNNITELFKLKHETFLNYQHSLSVESECTILKEQLQEKMKLIEQFVSLYKSGNEGNILKWYQEKCDIQLEVSITFIFTYNVEVSLLQNF